MIAFMDQGACASRQPWRRCARPIRRSTNRLPANGTGMEAHRCRHDPRKESQTPGLPAFRRRLETHPAGPVELPSSPASAEMRLISKPWLEEFGGTLHLLLDARVACISRLEIIGDFCAGGFPADFAFPQGVQPAERASFILGIAGEDEIFVPETAWNLPVQLHPALPWLEALRIYRVYAGHHAARYIRSGRQRGAGR